MKINLNHFKVSNNFIKIFLIFLSLVKINFAENTDIRFEHIGLDNGLSQINVHCILQDDQGFMWFGTEDGLNKYDGYKFTVFRHNPDDINSLSNNYVWTIFEDIEGILWVGTRGGLNKFNKKQETFTRYQHQADDPYTLSNNFVWSIFEDTRGVLWIGTEGGLNKFDRKHGKFNRYQHQVENATTLSNNDVRSICEDDEGILWVGTRDGLNKFDRKQEQFIRYRHQADNARSLSNSFIWSIYKDTRGVLWIGTEGGGLNKFDGKQETFTRYQYQVDDPLTLSNNDVWSIYEDAGGILWIGTRNGLNKFDREHEQFTHYQHQADNASSLSHNFIRSIYEDNGGLLWIGTYGGINKFDRKQEKFIHYQHQVKNNRSLSHNYVRSIYVDAQDILWVGTYNGLNKFDRKTQTFTRYQHQADNASSLSSSSIRSIYEDAEGRLWIGTRDGINKFNRKTQTFTRYQHQAGDPHSLNNDNVQLIYEDTEGILWIGTFGGLNKFDRKTETFTHYQYQIDNANSLSNNFVRAIYEDTGGTLWVGTYGGLNKFNRDKEIFTRYQHQADDPTTISNNSVRAIYEDAGGVLWVGTRGGLNKFDRDSHTFTYYREKDGLPNDVIYGILEDDKGMLWVSTNKGVSKFDPQTETFTNYDAGDGLQSNEFNAGAYHQDRSGRMYFGGIKGFNEFYPDSIKDNTSIPPVVITDFLLFNKPVSVGDTTILKHSSNFTEEIILDYTDYIFTFEFTALNYRQSEKNQFSYKLEGLNKEWIETNYKHRRATYTNLAPGEYIFRIKASNDDGYWNEKGTSIKVVILPPPWKTWWAYTLYIIVILGLIFWFIQSQRNKVKQKQRELLQLQSIFDNTTSIMYLKDLEGRYIMVNRCYEEMNNVTKEDVVNKTIYDIHPYQTAKVLEENDRKVLKKNKAIEFEEEIMQEDGLHTFISVRFPLNDSAGKPYAICGISMDITERKRAEEEMRHLRNLLSNIINSMPSAIIGVDRNGKVTQWNNGAEKVTQVKAEQAKGRLAHEVFTQCHLEVNKIKNAIKNRRVEQSLKVEQLLAGGITYCDITIFPLIANGVEGAVIRIDDVTEKVRLEEMMIQSEKMMSVGGLAAGMAHEINNPLAGIIQTMQVIQNRVSTDLPKNLKIAEECGISFDNLKKYHNRRGLIEMLKTVLESAHRAAKIVDNMLSFSRKSESKIIPVDMNELIDKTLDLCANDYDMKKNYEFRDLEIIREYVEDLSLVPCEVSEIQQVILNLLKNGAQAMQTENDQLRLNNGNVKKSGFILRVAHERDRNMMRIEVEDNGPGIDEATRRRIFEPFFTTKAEGSGIGLGLSVSYFIITENHGGEMWVESEVGRGTRFIIRLPL